jgi:glycosyltransferase involved in cell wall biosynthesis
MSLLANGWTERGWGVLLVTLDKNPPFFPLDPRVQLVQLDCERPSRTPFQAFWNLKMSRRLLRKLFRSWKPDAVLAFTTRVNIKALLAAQGLGIPVVISERSDPASNPLGRSWELLRRRWYPRAKALVVQTDTALDYFKELSFPRVVIVPNPVERVIVPDSVSRSGEFLFLAIARLGPEKGLDLLLEAFSRVSGSARLRILGDGPLREELEKQSRELGLAGRVEFAGFVSDKGPHLAEADAFVLSSRYEGFPNALCEAMAAGLPCVSFDCPSGPRAIIRDGENGLLVAPEDVQALAQGMERLLRDPKLRSRLGAQAKLLAEDLALPAILDRWEVLLLGEESAP